VSAFRIITVCIVSAALMPIAIALGSVWSGAHHVQRARIAPRPSPPPPPPPPEHTDAPPHVVVGLTAITPVLPEVVFEMTWPAMTPFDTRMSSLWIESSTPADATAVDLLHDALGDSVVWPRFDRPQPIHAPEPGPLVLLTAAGFGLASRRRR